MINYMPNGKDQMTSSVAAREIARQERRFEKLGFKNGLMLAKSAREYHDEVLALRGKVAAASKTYKAAKTRLAKLEAAAAKSGPCGRCSAEVLRLRRIVKSGERLISREHVAQLRLEEKVKRLATIPVVGE